MTRVRKGQTGSSSELDEVAELPRATDETLMQPRTVTVTWGEEVMQPIQFNGFRVGPITLTSPVLAGETVADAYERVWRDLDALGERQFQLKLATFKEHLRAAAASVREK